MKNRYSRLLAGVLVAVLCLGTAGCGATSEETAVFLDYGTGLDENGNYNDELYGMNNNDNKNADPGAIWVSEEEDPVYGGYFYMYVTSWETDTATAINTKWCEENGVAALAYMCYRSKNLYQWERCGTLPGGYSLQVDKEDWCRDKFWAPEVVKNPADGKYYMYFSASAAENWGANGVSSSSTLYDRLYLSVAVSDTPVGPFDVLCDTDVETGKRIPTINFHEGCNTEYDWAAIDVSPFFDDNGDLYLYFNKHQDSHYAHLNGAYGMKMLSMTQPDYSTITCLTQAGAVTASSTPGKIEDASSSGKYFYEESGVNEGPTMLKRNGKYYLTYSANGYAHQTYSVHQAVGDSPLGTFKKLDASANPVLDGSLLGYMVGTAHHCFVEKEDELYIIYHRHDTIYGYNTGRGRSISADRAQWVEKDGMEILTANGPTKSLQWLSESISGYKNLAQTANVKISTGTGVDYLTDELVPYYSTVEDFVMKSDEGDVKITFQWDEPVNIASVMIYNAKDAAYAFSKVSDVRFKLAEKPEWASEDYTYAVIKDLEFPALYWNPESEEYISCGPAVAEFDDLMVSELTITIKEEDRLVGVDKHGEVNKALKLSEIVILGGKE